MANLSTSKEREIKIFSLNRIKFNELYEDALKYVNATYNSVGQEVSVASPFVQMLLVVLHLGRMIFYYIEDSISGLNIRTAYRPDQVKGLAILTGHDSARSIASRGAIKIIYTGTDNELEGNVCYIPNKTKIINKLNGMTYTVLFGADNGKITMQNSGSNSLSANIIQGEIKMLYVTGTGKPFQSYNFQERNKGEIDQYFINVYVNSELWEKVDSILDLTYDQKGVIVRTGINGGIDIFFGNGAMGAIPPEGSYIVCEYMSVAGEAGDFSADYLNSARINDAVSYSPYWQWDGTGVMPDGTTVKLDGNFVISNETDLIFGTSSEDTTLTQLIAPHVSRSFVLANLTNYKYFFQKMNMFSNIQIFRGKSVVNGSSVMKLAYDLANENYQSALDSYNYFANTFGDTDEKTKKAYNDMQLALALKNYTTTKLSDNTQQDNTVYIFLVPDIKKRIGKAQNYFTCDESLFYLSEDEQANIINLINSSKQRIITVENRIILPKVVRFAVNVQAKIWDTYDEEAVYSSGLALLSEYFINFERKDIIPVSDIISIFENKVDGIDSVKVWFDADINNQDIFGEGNYGIDEYGDIILTRETQDYNQLTFAVKDILPLIRGGFTSPKGIEYSDVQSKDGFSAFNLHIIGKTTNRKNYTTLS